MWAVSAPWEVGRDGHPGSGGGPKVAHNAAPRCQLRGLGMDIHVAHPLTCPLDVTMERLHPHCTPLRCCCSVAVSHNICTTPKVALVVNVPTHAWSSHSEERMAWASLDQDEAQEDDFQTQHTPVHRMM